MTASSGLPGSGSPSSGVLSRNRYFIVDLRRSGRPRQPPSTSSRTGGPVEDIIADSGPAVPHSRAAGTRPRCPTACSAAQPQRQPRTGGDGRAGRRDERVRDRLPGHDRVAPLGEFDELGKQSRAESLGGAGDVVDAQPLPCRAAPVHPSPPLSSSSGPAAAGQGRPARCAARSAGKASTALRTRRVAPFGCAHAPRPAVGSARCPAPRGSSGGGRGPPATGGEGGGGAGGPHAPGAPPPAPPAGPEA